MPYYDDTKQTADQRDKTILDLRKHGYTYRAIAGKLGMTPAGVLYALHRIQDGRPGKDPRP
jgi:DNA-binding CsgD family transcriptional regulator